MKLKSLRAIKSLRGKRVLLRLDLNIPLDGKINKKEAWRIERSLPTIQYLVKKKAKVIIISHLGRPKGRDNKLSLLPISQYLSKLLNQGVEFWSDDFKGYYQDSLRLANGNISMLENIRFYDREEKNCKRLAKSLSKLGDIYINDAFAVCHRNHSSVLGITEHLPSYAGLLLLEEVKVLSNVLKTKKGLSVILGGAKTKTKLPLIKKFNNISNDILLGGVLANTFLKARKYSIGKSLYDKKSISLVNKIKSKKIHLPTDVVIVKSLKSKKGNNVDIDNISNNSLILDLGSKTIKEYINILSKSKTIVWNGPLGYFENSFFSKGSVKLIKALSKTKAKIIIGGGETVALVKSINLDNKLYFISTGGGAMLYFLQESKMLALEKLKK